MLKKYKKLNIKSSSATPVQLRRLLEASMLVAISLVIFMFEQFIPNIVPVPGVKLGLANIVTVYAMFKLGAKYALSISFVRIILASLFTARVMSLPYSLAGGICSFLLLLLLVKIMDKQQLWLASALSAMAHNFGQLIVASLLISSSAVFVFLPWLLIAASVAGSITGLIAQKLINRNDIYSTHKNQ